MLGVYSVGNSIIAYKADNRIISNTHNSIVEVINDMENEVDREKIIEFLIDKNKLKENEINDF